MDWGRDALNAPKMFAVFSSDSNFIFRSMCIRALPRTARYALICQAEDLVPIVEPDISLKGDHDLETAVFVNVKVQSALYKAMLDHGTSDVMCAPFKCRMA